jgi:hypothetical protein
MCGDLATATVSLPAYARRTVNQAEPGLLFAQETGEAGFHLLQNQGKML